MLTDSQVRHFQVFGFVIFRGLLLQKEITTADEEFNVRLSTARQQTDERGIRETIQLDEPRTGFAFPGITPGGFAFPRTRRTASR